MASEDLSLWLSQPVDLTIPTERDSVVLRRYQPEDASLIFQAIDFDRQHLSQFGDNTARKYPSVESVEASILNPDSGQPGRLRCGIWDLDLNTIVGGAIINPDLEEFGRAEVGYWIGGNYLRRGYASVGVRAITQFAFDVLKVREVFGDVVVGNYASKGVLEKSGYIFDKEVEEVRNQVIKKYWRFKRNKDR